MLWSSALVRLGACFGWICGSELSGLVSLLACFGSAAREMLEILIVDTDEGLLRHEDVVYTHTQHTNVHKRDDCWGRGAIFAVGCRYYEGT
jgi:hypothetical protein